MAEAVTGAYAHALRREILRSEQRRMRALAILLALLLTTILIVLGVAPRFSRQLFPQGISPWVPIAGIGSFVLFEVAALGMLRWRIARDRDFPQPARFANALVETSLPGVVILVLSHYMEPRLVFGFWPPLLYFIFIVLSTLRLDFWLSLWTGAVAAVEQVALAYWLLPVSTTASRADETIYYHLSRSIMLLLAGIVAAVVAQSLRRQFENSVAAGAARDRVTNLFGQHVSPAVVDRLLATQADPPSEIRPVCVLFLDIRGFTAMSRARSAGETVALLNDFFAGMVAIVDRHGGIVNKFLGDGFLAVFGAPLADPQAAAHALAAGRDMLAAVDEWNRARPAQALRVGIGIHAGEAVTGTVGSAQRKEYTVIGDTVNLAARLEQLTKDTGARLLVSDALGGLARSGGGVDLGPMAIRGYGEPVNVWKVA
ncbi:adenylate/guanylate cyclase domain-containing protein [Reyranella sp.]|uniref:adenylate/guanylate cyclase domain-containing protein n=1 Tax=Reyranella sp. TaxID=1929291 RepID=UPI002F95F569